jgi:glutaredoxin|tara:strand:+ start:364 stop:615 length:252 start_codon:yes stop_codon:yes gene_type:complete
MHGFGENSMPDVKIITGILCGYCDAAKSLLKFHNQDYEEVDVFEASALMEEYNLKTVPQIFIDGELVEGGYTGLKGYYDGQDS